MNHFFHENTDKHAKVNFTEVDDRTIQDFFDAGIRLITVDDAEYDDYYAISLEKTAGAVKGISGVCFHNHRPSYQADFRDGGDLKLKQVINKIAARALFEVSEEAN